MSQSQDQKGQTTTTPKKDVVVQVEVLGANGGTKWHR